MLFKMVEIEINRACNRRCYYCPNSTLDCDPGLPDYMPDDVLHTVLTGLQDVGFAGRLSFHFYGEPLLHPDLVRIVGLFRQGLDGSRLVLYTNGDFLSDSKYHELVMAGVDLFVVTSHDDRDVEGRENQVVLKRWDLVLTNRGGLLGPSLQSPLAVPCMVPSTMLIVTITGQVVLCYEDAARSQVMGNVLNASLGQIWYCERFVAIREQLALGNRDATAICRRCSNRSHPTGEVFDYVP